MSARSPEITQSVAMTGWPMDDRQDDIISLFLEFQDELHVFQFVPGAKIDRGGRTEEIHPFGTASGPGRDVFEIESAVFLLKKYSHTLHSAPHQFF
jgi:hypothetical protein